jgi:hypothetical protein
VAIYSSPQLPIYLAAHLGERGVPDGAFLSHDRDGSGLEWGDYQYRRARYAVNWAHYDGTIYRAHAWSRDYLELADLFEYTRPIYSPAYRIGEFWPGHLFGGTLDPEAGDGRERPSACPIALPEDHPKADALRAAIAAIWRDSVWAANKDTFTRQGTVLGDAVLIGVDDEARRQVYMRAIHPATVETLEVDHRGNVRGYTIREKRPDPREGSLGRACWYVEMATRTGEGVHFQTYLDDGLGTLEPWDWRPEPEPWRPEWTEDYGFIPMVRVQHRDMGLGWGWSEYHGSLAKFLELDDQASRLGDQNRKELQPIWYFAGAEAGEVSLTSPENTTDDPHKGRRARYTMFGPAGSEPHPMVGSLDIPGCLANIRGILEVLEREHPELLADDVGPGDSGAARRVAREKVEALVVGRRAGYDDALVRMHKMLISIGAAKGYPGFEAFDEGSYERGELDHAIGDRPVFSVSTAERLAEANARGTALKLFTDAGLPRRMAMAQVGFSPEEIDEAEALAEREQAASQGRQAVAFRQQAEARRAAELGEDGADEEIAGPDR